MENVTGKQELNSAKAVCVRFGKVGWLGFMAYQPL